MNLAKNVSSVVLQVTLIIIFISIFFLSYTTVIEKDIVVAESDGLIDEMFGDLKLVLSPWQVDLLRESVTSLKSPDMTEADALTAASNKILTDNTIFIMLLVGVVGFAITGYISYRYKVDMSELSKEAIFGLIAVCIVEYVFLTFLVKNYRSLDPNTIKLHIVEILQKYGSN
jgi:hypothetical protein